MGAKNLKKLPSVIQIHFTREIFFVKQTMRFKEKQLQTQYNNYITKFWQEKYFVPVPDTAVSAVISHLSQ